jgi:putative transposase
VKQFKKLSHAVWQCKYHIVWCPKYRFRILRDEVGKSIRDIIRQLCAWRNIDILEGNVQIDHIHLILSIPPKYSVSEAVGFLKGKSAIKIFDIHHELKKRYWGRHFWAKGDLCKTSLFARFLCQAQILILKILNVFQWLKFSPSLNLNKN